MRQTLVVAMVLAGTSAYAEPDHRGEPGALGAPADPRWRPLVLDAGAVDLRVTAEINVQPRFVARPLSFAPDAWWGISPRWTIGLIHSNASVDRIDAGATFCVRESAISTCNRLYRGSGLDVRFGAREGDLAVAPRVRVLVRDVDPFKPAATLGAVLRWTRGRFAVTSDPYLRVPLANHDLGNRTALMLPIWFAVQPIRGSAIVVHTGYDADLAVLRDGFHVPLGLGVTQRLPYHVELGAEAGWFALLGPQHNSQRGTLMITAGWQR